MRERERVEHEARKRRESAEDSDEHEGTHGRGHRQAPGREETRKDADHG